MSNLNFTRWHTFFLVCIVVSYYALASTTLVYSILMGAMAIVATTFIWLLYFAAKKDGPPMNTENIFEPNEEMMLPGEPFSRGQKVTLNIHGHAASVNIPEGTEGVIAEHKVTHNGDYMYLVELSDGTAISYFGDEFDVVA